MISPLRRPVPAKIQGRGVRDPEADVQAGLEEAGVGVAGEAVLGPAGRRIRPLVAGDLERAAVAVERVGG
jgi:hypothetical protein